MVGSVEFNTTTTIVDDTVNFIEYSAGWTIGLSGEEILDREAEYMRTKHGAKTAGPTAKFNFTGTSIAVYGSLGSVDIYGIPVSSNPTNELHAATYTAPIILPGGFETNVLSHQSPTLAPGLHELLVTNLNGTAPSELWLDFFFYDPSTTTGETGVATPVAAEQLLQNIRPPLEKSSVALLARRQQADLLEPTSSATSFRYRGFNQNFFASPFANPEERSRANVLPTKRIVSFSATPNSSPTSGDPSTNRTSSVPQGLEPSGTTAVLSGTPVIRHTDSGKTPNSYGSTA